MSSEYTKLNLAAEEVETSNRIFAVIEEWSDYLTKNIPEFGGPEL